jgi:ceramide glucosyltransferase
LFEIAWLLILGGITLFNILVTARSLFYIRYEFPRRIAPRFRKDFTPSVSVFVPCKGMEEGLEEFLESLARQDYPDFNVTFITESDEDEASGPIARVIARHHHARHVVAGKTETCCQKNHNLLAGLSTDRGSEVYVFADADAGASVTWLRDLVAPLSIEKYAASTGFRWLTPPSFSLAGMCHAMLSGYIMTLLPDGKGMWGGSMAIRSADFRQMAAAERWRTTVVDDISLSDLLFRNGKGRLFVPTCICESTGTLGTIRSVAAWFTRQVMYLKIYLRPLWLAAVAVHSTYFAATAGSLIFLLLYLTTGRFPAAAVGGAAFLLISMINTAALKSLRPGRGSALLWGLLTIPSLVVGVWCLIASGLTESMVWRNMRYRVDGRGNVTSIEEIAA